MFCSKLLIAATMIRALQAQENGPEYVNIVAGENPLTFVHPELPAGINDVIVWSFISGGNHSVIQSSYENPCHYLPGGFYSGFQAVPPRPQGGTESGPVQFLVTINSTDPIYYFCGQIGHCQGGMVGVINPPCNGNGIDSPGSYNDYKSRAMAVTSVGPLPSVITGGRLVPAGSVSGTPPGPPGPYYTGFSASCTAGTNSSSNSSESTTSSTTSATTSSILSASSSSSSPSSGTTTSTQLTTSSSTTTSASTSNTFSTSQSSSSPNSETTISTQLTTSSSATTIFTTPSTTSSSLPSNFSSSSRFVNSTKSTASFATTSATTSATITATVSATSSGLQPISSSGGSSIYGYNSLIHGHLLSLIWQVWSPFGLVIAILFAFVML